MSGHADEVLEIAGLGEREFQAYSLILALGNVTMGDLILLMENMNVGEAEEIISRLENEKMIVTLPGIVPRYQAVPPFEGLAKEVREITDRITGIRDELRQELLDASKSVRDALLNITRDHLDAIVKQESGIEEHHKEALTRLHGVVEEGKTQASKMEEGRGAEIKTAYDSWLEETSGSISTAFEHMRSTLSPTTNELNNAIRDVQSATEDLVSRLNDDVVRGTDELAGAITDGLNAQAESLRAEITGRVDALGKVLEEHRNGIAEKLGELGETVLTTGNSLSADVTASMGETLNSAEQSLSQAIEKTGKHLESITEHIRSIVEEEKQVGTEILNGFVLRQDELLQAFREECITAVGSFKESIDTTAAELQETGRTSITAISDQLDGFARRTETSLTNTMETMKTASTGAIRSMYDGTAEASSEITEESRALLRGSRQELTNSINQLRAALDNLNSRSLEEKQAFLSAMENELTEQATNAAEEARQGIQQIVERTRQEIAQLGETLKQQITTSITRATDGIREIGESALEAINAGLSKTTGSISGRIEDLGERARSQHDTLTGTIAREVEQQTARHGDAVEGVLSKIDELQEHLINRIDGLRRESTQSVEETLQTASSAAVESVGAMAEESKGLIENLSASLREAVESGKRGSVTAGDGVVRGASSAIEKLARSAGEVQTSSREQLEQAMDNLLESVGSIISNGVRDIHEGLEGASEAMREQIEGVQERARSDLIGAGERGKQELGSAAGLISEAFQESVSAIDSEKTSAIEGVSSFVNQMSTMIAEKCDVLKQGTAAAVSAFRNRVTTKTEAAATGIDAAVTSLTGDIEKTERMVARAVTEGGSAFRDIALGAVESVTRDSINAFDTFGTGTESTVSAVYDSIKSSITALKSSLTEHASRLEDSALLGITEERIEGALAETETEGLAGADIGAILSDAWNRLSATGFPGAKHTWTVVTRRAVLAHMTDMIKRAKSKITLILPDPREIPVDLLTEMKSSIGVELVVSEGVGLEQTVKPLVGRGNIRVRLRSEKDVYACVRDSEEVILAPAADRDSDVVGMTSEYEGFVKFVMSIIGPIFQARTKMVRPGDL